MMLRSIRWAATVCLFFCAVHTSERASACTGDVNGDRIVNAVDLATLLSQWSANAPGASCDLDGNGRVEGVDLGMMLAAWGPCPQPTLQSVAPSEGLITGGTTITIVGTNLQHVQSVRVCGILASSAIALDNNTITAVTTATGGSYPGLGPVTVTTTGGTATLSDAFRYVAPSPTLETVSPSSGPPSGSTSVLLTGTHFVPPVAVTFGGVPATNVQVLSPSTVRAFSPGGAIGPCDVAVTTAAGTATLANAFSYVPPPPTISSVTPTVGRVTGGTMVTVRGTNFVHPVQVEFGDVLGASVEVISPDSLTVVSPARTAGECDVAVTTAGGTAVRSNAFRFTEGPYAPPWSTLLDEHVDASVVVDPEVRAAIAATGYAWRVRDLATQIEMVLIPPGTFDMGCSPSDQLACEGDESPVRTVVLKHPIYVGRYEVTQTQWIARFGSNPSFFSGPGGDLSRPVENVSLNFVQVFLSQAGLRLPTEAEWEYAYRAGTTTAFHGWAAQSNGTNNDALLSNIAWCDSNNSPYGTKPVGQKPSNGFGLHDMAGNVMEWVSDWYGADYYLTAPTVNPTGPSAGSLRIVRGGAWGSNANFCRSSKRYAVSPTLKNGSIGFRVARNP
jgi:formylglycine-generating enzyme required for sulfatase activity